MGYPANELQILKRPMHMLMPVRGCKFAGPLRAFKQRRLTSVFVVSLERLMFELHNKDINRTVIVDFSITLSAIFFHI